MKIKKLHIKFFLIFLEAILINQLLILGMFRLLIGRNLERTARSYASASVFTFKRLVELTIKNDPKQQIKNNIKLRSTLKELAKQYKAKIWMMSPDKKMLVQTFEGSTPTLPKNLIQKGKQFTIPRHLHKGLPQFVYINIKQNKKKQLHLIINFSDQRNIPFETASILGMIVITLFAIVLLFPIYKYITRPLKKLRETALLISDGDLSQRAPIKSVDEVGELGKAFNTMAETLERMIQGARELTANVSHELRSPLARIRVAEELLRMQIEKNSNKQIDFKHLEIIRSEIEEMDQLIGQILTLSRQDLQPGTHHKFEFDLSELIEEVAGRHAYACENKQIELELLTPEMPLFIFADKEGLKTAFSNLIDNAIKFTQPNGKIRVTLSYKNKQASLSISNPLSGDPITESEKLFKPFYRPDNQHSLGTGLGLAIVKKIIDHHKGTIKIKCENNIFVVEVCL